MTEHGTYVVLAGLIQHLGRFLKPFHYDRKRDRFLPLPKLLCSKDDRRMAQALIEETGFSPCHTRDLDGNEKFLLDFAAYNNGDIEEDRTDKMRRAYRILEHHLHW